MGAVTLLTGCDLNEEPQAQASVDMMFASETGLKTYHYSFYNVLPDRESAVKGEWTQTDYLPHATLGSLENGTYLEESATSWSWSALRNINFFLEKNVDTRVSEEVRNNYNGIARFFRARFYFEKIKVFGQVPWVDKVFNELDDPGLMAPRDSRDVLIDHMIEDLDFAYENMTQKTAPWNASTLTKWIPMAYKARVLLYEASWRRYHAGTNFVKGCEKYTPEELYQMAADAAKEVIEKSPYKLYTTGTYANGAGGPFRRIFTEDNAVTTEVMLAQVYDEELAYRGAQNYYYNRQATTVRQSFSRKFMNSFLNKDGSPYEELKDGKHKNFVDETTNRDPRLNMSIRAHDYKMKNSAGIMELTTAPFQNHTVTGYHPTKIVTDDVTINDSQYNINDYPLMRFAEVLLNYAEAMAELGKMDNDVWTQTIGALRKRAGITGGTPATGTLTTSPSGSPDPIIAAYYPGVTDPKILEVRRERACELALEGFRPDDLKRWRMGELFVNDPWQGIFFEALETPIDVNNDGVYDVYFHTGTNPKKTQYKSIAVQLPGTAKNPLTCDKVDDGYLLRWGLEGREWPERQYLRPIPITVLRKNPNLGQNPGWKDENGAEQPLR